MPSGGVTAQREIASWSNVCKTRTRLVSFARSDAAALLQTGAPLIARGNGNSYGDAAFVSEGTTVSSDALRELGPLDVRTELVECGAGVTILELQRYLEPRGYHFPVYGGTQRATVGGAIASDIHGKNHFRVGSFGNHVRELTVLTASGDELRCSPDQDAELFAATIGGMGLTGIVTRACLAVQPRRAFSVHVSAQRADQEAELLPALVAAQGDFAVCDWFEPTRSDFHAIVYRGDYVLGSQRDSSGFRLTLPLPRWNAFRKPVLRGLTYASWQATRLLPVVTHVNRFNYGGPHEFIENWNQLFGKAGFFEYHFGVAFADALTALRLFSREARARGLYPLFGCLKPFGVIPPVGMLSFSRPGLGVNVQVEASPESARFLRWFTDYLIEVGGRVYLAKDAVLTPTQFRRICPDLERFEIALERIDPRGRFQSDLSRRLGLKQSSRRGMA